MTASYACDWCHAGFPFGELSEVRIKNVYNQPAGLHICASCGKDVMPERVHPMLSWTAPMEPPEGGS